MAVHIFLGCLQPTFHASLDMHSAGVLLSGRALVWHMLQSRLLSTPSIQSKQLNKPQSDLHNLLLHVTVQRHSTVWVPPCTPACTRTLLKV